MESKLQRKIPYKTHQYIHKNDELFLENEGKKPIIVVAENINPHNIANFHWVDAWVVTACPRIAIDDKIRYSAPVVTFREFLYLVKEITWDDLLKDGFF